MFSDWRLRLRALFKRSTVEREMDDELRFHFDHHVDSYVARGLSHEAAVRRVRLEFGGLDQVKAEYRDALGVRLIDSLIRDVRLAFRQFRTHPTFALVTVLVLGLGTGAATAVFTIVDSVVLRPLPGRSIRSTRHPLGHQCRARRYPRSDIAGVLHGVPSLAGISRCGRLVATACEPG